jgi:hypothetical protein
VFVATDVRNTGRVSGDDDDEALTWAGGRDPSHYETPEAKAPRPSKRVAGGRSDVAAAPSVAADGQPPATSATVLVSLGILGGIYLLYTVGWFISWQRLVYTDPDVLELAAFRIQQVLAILAAPLWFTFTLLFTRERKPAVRLLWLVVGALLLIPWSFTFGR